MNTKQYARRFRAIGMVSFFFGAILAALYVTLNARFTDANSVDTPETKKVTVAMISANQ